MNRVRTFSMNPFEWTYPQSPGNVQRQPRSINLIKIGRSVHVDDIYKRKLLYLLFTKITLTVTEHKKLVSVVDVCT
jgi:hypothetical protein